MRMQSFLAIAVVLTIRDVSLAQDVDKKSGRFDQYGDRLPKGAQYQLGTIRMRHPIDASSLVFSPDGKILASGSWFGNACLWDVQEGKELHRLQTPDSGALAFSANGKLLATGGAASEVRIWDVKTGQLLRAMQGQKPGLVPGQPFREGEKDRVRVYAAALAFSDDGKTLVYAATYGYGYDGDAFVWDVATGKKRLHSKLPTTDQIYAVALAPGGKLLASSVRWKNFRDPKLEPGPISIWDTETGKEIRRWHPPKGSATSLGFSPDGKMLASDAIREPLVLWDVGTGKEIRILEGAASGWGRLTFSPDGQTVAHGGSSLLKGGCTFQLWETATGKQTVAIEDLLLGSWASPALAPDGKILAVAENNTIHLFNAGTGKKIKAPEGPNASINSLSILTDGKTCAVEEYDGVWFWDLATGKSQKKITRTSYHGVVSVAPDGKRFHVVIRGQDFGTGYIHVDRYETASGKHLDRLVEITSATASHGVFPFAFSADGQKFAAPLGKHVTLGSPVHLWDIAQKKPLLRLPSLGPNAPVAFSPDGKMLVTVCTPGIYLWNADTGKEIQRFPLKNASGVRAISISTDGKTLASLGPDLILWSVQTGKQRHEISNVGHGALAMSADNMLVAAEGKNNAVCLWDIDTGQQRHCFAGHRSGITALAFSQDGRTLISGGADATALIWELPQVARSQK